MNWKKYLNDKVACKNCKCKTLRDEIEKNKGLCDDCRYQGSPLLRDNKPTTIINFKK